MIHILLNPLSNNGKGKEAEGELKELFKDKELDFLDVTTVSSVAETCKGFAADDTIVVAGGDGTLTHFVNDVYELKLPQKIFLYFCGTGNDFMFDVKDKVTIENKLIPINDFIVSLPKVYVNGMTKYFINGIGFGIEGYCCEEGDKIRATSDKPVNYTAIAIKGLLYKFKPRNATVTVDGVEKKYKKVWLAPAMMGRYIGGGMIMAPGQDRLNPEKTLTNVIWSNTGKLSTLMKFPSIFKGEHVKYTKNIDVRTGHEIKVEFDKPCALQIDGETVLNVTTYTAVYGK
jgi:diacylglycerol kinase family enzyme